MNFVFICKSWTTALTIINILHVLRFSRRISRFAVFKVRRRVFFSLRPVYNSKHVICIHKLLLFFFKELHSARVGRRFKNTCFLDIRLYLKKKRSENCRGRRRYVVFSKCRLSCCASCAELLRHARIFESKFPRQKDIFPRKSDATAVYYILYCRREKKTFNFLLSARYSDSKTRSIY